MKFSKKSRYGLISLIDLSVHAKNGHVALNSIAERNDISPQYLEQVFVCIAQSRNRKKYQMNRRRISAESSGRENYSGRDSGSTGWNISHCG